ncbi:hypothetical protein PPROV_000549500 [Pycnococcus provasolii]|uniref:Fatty acid desaturase domain-containing protein n=1 Tax=Pycnococcus provasolii TaxID=41880 RepID=A0A830HMH2_9CHLO|nr:hypothetical protein PPROV_000549500 [Pycnococcus provasolii]
MLWLSWKLLSGYAGFLLPLMAIAHDISHEGIPSVRTLLAVALLTMLNIGVCMSVVLHRYFSHSAFRTTRAFQFVLGVIGCLAYQCGPVWWASKHRRHHANCDTALDPHSWTMTSHWYAWWGWTLNPSEQTIDYQYVHNLVKYKELLILDELWLLVPSLLMASVYNLAGPHCATAYVATPLFLSRMITLLFNCEYHPPASKTKCKSIDNPRILSELVGESYHDDHHAHPRRLHRPGLDLPYWIFIRPLIALRMIWPVGAI